MIKQLTTQDSTGGGGGGSGGWTVYTQTVTVGGTITLSTADFQQTIIIVGNAAPVTTAALPFAGTPSNGSMVRLIGSSDVNTVTVNNGVGIILNGNITIGQYDAIDFQYISSLSAFIEVSRS